jgi:polyisoprenoid-binding protein YceI
VSEGQFTIRRLDFNVGDGRWSDPTVVADDVLVRVRMVLPRSA